MKNITDRIIEIDQDKARRFVYSYRRGKSVSISNKGKFYGYIKEGQLIGIISTQLIGSYIRIKSFLVMDIFRGMGYGTKLLSFVHFEGNKYSAFATKESIKLFKKFGYKEVSNKSNNIKYLKYE